MTKRALNVSAASLAMIIILSGCSNSTGPAPDAAGTAAPPPPPLFGSTPGDVVQSPGNYVPPPNGRPYRGN